jgi:hypothetical protein
MKQAKNTSQSKKQDRKGPKLRWGSRVENHDKRCRELFDKFELTAQHEMESDTAHRKAIYSGLAVVAAEKLELDGDPQFEKAVLRRIGEKNDWPESRLKSKRLNLLKELCALAMGATTKEQEKLASKRGKVVRILLDDNVEPSVFPKEIKRRGGIEKIAALEGSKGGRKESSSSNTLALRISGKASACQKWISAEGGSCVTLTGIKVGEHALRLKSSFVVGGDDVSDDDDDDEASSSLAVAHG